MANGWAHDGAVHDQIDDTVTDAVKRARAMLEGAEGADECNDCGAVIPKARRRALPAARTCVPCQSLRDASRPNVGINRRGSKDSQLR